MKTSTHSSSFHATEQNGLESGTEADSPPLFLSLSSYDRDLSERLAVSSKTAPAVRHMARLLLELGRLSSLEHAAERTGLSCQMLAELRQTYLWGGLQEVLSMSQQLPMPVTPPVRLTAAERAFCRQVLESCEGSKGRLRRAKALLLLDEGKSKDTIASETQVCSRTLERLAERCQIYGVTGAVNDAERPGRPQCYPKSEFVPLIREVMGHEPPTTRFRWTATDLRRVLAHHRPEAARMSMPTLRALVTAAGFGYGYAPKGAASMSLSA